MAAQLVAAYNAAMECYRRAMSANRPSRDGARISREPLLPILCDAARPLPTDYLQALPRVIKTLSSMVAMQPEPWLVAGTLRSFR